MSTVGKWIIRLFAAVGVLATVAALGFALTGISAREDPPRAEVVMARAARGLLIPASTARARNPLLPTPESLRSARAHWADHCASCHGNDGKGDTKMGRNLYPRAPDMTAPATQELSDGELFWIIENGIKLTGMPAWGADSHEDDAETWELVQLIRLLPALTEAELAEMKRHNPISRAELEQELEMERFLAGEDAPPAPTEPHH
jgi:cytochrome c553